MSSYILQFGHYVFEVYYWLILISIFGSWFPSFQSTKLSKLITKLVEPYLAFFRRFIPPLGPIDFSPIVALLIYSYLKSFALEGLRQSLNVISI